MDNRIHVYRVWNNHTGQWVSSGRGLYAKNQRTIWMAKSGAVKTINNLPAAERGDCIVRKFVLVEVTDV